MTYLERMGEAGRLPAQHRNIQSKHEARGNESKTGCGYMGAKVPTLQSTKPRAGAHDAAGV